MKHPSFRKRLLLASSVGLFLFLFVAGFVIHLSFQKSLLAAQKERMRLQIEALLAVAEVEGNKVRLPSSLYEAQFGQVESAIFFDCGYLWLFCGFYYCFEFAVLALDFVVG